MLVLFLSGWELCVNLHVGLSDTTQQLLMLMLFVGMTSCELTGWPIGYLYRTAINSFLFFLFSTA
jgi:hypothetical protein